MEIIREYADWFYLVGAVLFILTLRGLSGPKTAIAGNRYGMIAMAPITPLPATGCSYLPLSCLAGP